MRSERRADRRESRVLTIGVCARWMGVTTKWLLTDWRRGILVANNIGRSGRVSLRIYFEDFVAYLRHREVQWSRIPASLDDLLRVAGRRHADRAPGAPQTPGTTCRTETPTTRGAT